ncbi:hypothetical protein V8V91_14320 [Algoriphagus halophilus]|uniref:hypothetical protein n=1 Tax=Algoriphagus halophilus TaxID=226505 RepID=UPI00358FD28B
MMGKNEEVEKESTSNKPKEKRGWASYLKEFFMLFLAIFCGFLAENYRESLSAQKIEKEYMVSLMEDLKTDTTNLKSYISSMKERSKIMDSLALMMLSDERNQFGNQIYFLARQVFNEEPFIYSDGTIQQLKNAGNLRLIKKETLSMNYSSMKRK